MSRPETFEMILVNQHRDKEVYFPLSYVQLSADSVSYLILSTCCSGQLNLAIPPRVDLCNKCRSVRAGTWTGTASDALALYPWSSSVNWCTAEGWANGDQLGRA